MLLLGDGCFRIHSGPLSPGPSHCTGRLHEQYSRGISCLFFFFSLSLKLSWIKLPLFSRVGCSVPGKKGCLERWGIGNIFNKPTIKCVGTEQNQTAYTTFCSATDTTQSQQPTSMPSSEAFHADSYTPHPSHICSSTAEENRREVATEQERKAFCCTEAKKLSVV